MKALRRKLHWFFVGRHQVEALEWVIENIEISITNMSRKHEGMSISGMELAVELIEILKDEIEK